jgi:hypothetical protein
MIKADVSSETFRGCTKQIFFCLYDIHNVCDGIVTLVMFKCHMIDVNEVLDNHQFFKEN